MDIIGLVVGSVALLLVFIFRFWDKEREVDAIKSEINADFSTFKVEVSTRLEEPRRQIEALLQRSEQIVRSVETLPTDHFRPGLSTYLANQWKFIEKTFKSRHTKHDICRRIVQQYIFDNTTVLLDSGSTIDLITYELLGSNRRNVKVHTNNVFAAMHLVATSEIELHLLGGVFDERYAAVYSQESFNRIDQLSIDVYILAATAIRFNEGILVYRDDKHNQNFKRSLVEAFVGTRNSKLIIAVDDSKFITPIEQHKSIMESGDWFNFLSEYRERIFIVTSQPPYDMDAIKRVEIDKEINMYKELGIIVQSG